MLKDPRWDVEIEIPSAKELLSDHKRLIEFCKTKDPKARYNYLDPNNCLLAQYLRYHGYNNPPLDAARAGSCLVQNPLDNIAQAMHVWSPNTFGAAQRRAEKQLYGFWGYLLRKVGFIKST